MDSLPHSPAADRNKEPILAALRGILGESGSALEIASGTGQHLAHFAAAFPLWTWQPTEADAAMLPAIAQRTRAAGLPNVLAPLQLDVTAGAWPVGTGFDAIFCANMLHIAPWAACAGLMQGASRHLAAGGVLITYGPYLEDAVPTADSNRAFDASLRSRNAAWGIRRIEDVAAEAGRAGLTMRQRHTLPANNLLLVFAQ